MFVRKGLSSLYTSSRVQRKGALCSQQGHRYNSSVLDGTLRVDQSSVSESNIDLANDPIDQTDVSLELENDDEELEDMYETSLESAEKLEKQREKERQAKEEDGLVTMSNHARNIRLNSSGEWVDILNRHPQDVLTAPGDTISYKAPDGYQRTRHRLFTNYLDGVPKSIVNHLEHNQNLLNAVVRSSNPEMQKFLPFRDRLAESIHRLHPVLLRHLFVLYTKFAKNAENTEFLNIPMDQVVYLSIIAKFLHMKIEYVRAKKADLYNVKLFSPDTPIAIGGLTHIHLPRDMITALQETTRDIAPRTQVPAHRDRLPASARGNSVPKAMVRTDIRRFESQTIHNAEYKGYTVYNADSPSTPVHVIPPHENRPEGIPAQDVRDVFLNLLEKKQIIMVVGSTGSGKSTQFPQFILDHAKANGTTCNIWLTQPRRVAAISICKRIIHEQGGEFESRQIKKNTDINYTQSPRKKGTYTRIPIGYTIRGEHYTSPDTELTICTMAIQLKKIIMCNLPKKDVAYLKEDPRNEAFWTGKHSLLVRKAVFCLGNLTHIFIDEVHEGSMTADLQQSILRDAQPHLPRQKVVLMSATADTTSLTKYLNVDTVVSMKGRMYHVDVFYEDDVYHQLSNETHTKTWNARKKQLIRYLAHEYQNGVVRTPEVDGLRIEAILKYMPPPDLQHYQSEHDFSMTNLDAAGVSYQLVLQLLRNITKNFVDGDYEDTKYSQKLPAGAESVGEPTFSNVRSTLPLPMYAHRDLVIQRKKKGVSNKSHDDIVDLASPDTLDTLFDDSEGTIVPEEQNEDEALIYSEKLMEEVISKISQLNLSAPHTWENKLPRGTILIFAPTWGIIMELQRQLRMDEQFGNPRRYRMVPMHSTLSLDQMLRAIVPVDGIITIVIATNIAETSLTIPNVACVIDLGNGLNDISDHLEGTQVLPLEYTPTSSMNQRKGRAGRTRPAVCFRMFKKEKIAMQPRFPRPAALVEDIDSTILSILTFMQEDRNNMRVDKVNGKELIHLFNVRLPTKLNSFNIDNAYDRLVQMGFIDDAGNILDLGKMALHLSLPTKAVRVLVFGLLHGCIDSALTVAAYLTYPRYIVTVVDSMHASMDDEQKPKKSVSDLNDLAGTKQSEFALAINLFNAFVESGCTADFCEEYGVSYQTMRNWLQARVNSFQEIQNTPLKYLLENLDIDKQTSRLSTLTRSILDDSKLNTLKKNLGYTEEHKSKKGESVFLDELVKASTATLAMPMTRVYEEQQANVATMLKQKLVEFSKPDDDKQESLPMYGNVTSVHNGKNDLLKKHVLHANLLNEKPYYVENVIHAALYPNIAHISAVYSNDSSYHCRPPMTSVGMIPTHFMQKYTQMHPHAAFSSNMIQRSGLTLAASGMLPSHALMQTSPGDQPCTKKLEEQMNELITQGRMYHQGHKDTKASEVRYISNQQTHAHAHAKTTPNMNLDEVLDNVFWDCNLVDMPSKMEYLRTHGAVGESGIRETVEIQGLVGLFEELPSVEHVLHKMCSILKGKDFVPSRSNDFSKGSRVSHDVGRYDEAEIDWSFKTRVMTLGILHRAVYSVLDTHMLNKSYAAQSIEFLGENPSVKYISKRYKLRQPKQLAFRIRLQEYQAYKAKTCADCEAGQKAWIPEYRHGEMGATGQTVKDMTNIYTEQSQAILSAQSNMPNTDQLEIPYGTDTNLSNQAPMLLAHHYRRYNESTNANPLTFANEINSIYAGLPMFHKKGVTVELDADIQLLDNWLGFKGDKETIQTLRNVRDTASELFYAAARTSVHGSESYQQLGKLWRLTSLLSDYNQKVHQNPSFTGIEGRTPYPIDPLVSSDDICISDTAEQSQAEKTLRSILNM